MRGENGFFFWGACVVLTAAGCGGGDSGSAGAGGADASTVFDADTKSDASEGEAGSGGGGDSGGESGADASDDRDGGDATRCQFEPPNCDLFPACGCADGTKCAWRPGDFPSCVQVTGAAAVGASCAKDSECVAGTVCAGGICKSYCGDAGDCASRSCAPIIDPVAGTVVAGASACADDCDWSSRSDCGDGRACRVRFAPGIADYLDCVASTGVGGDHATCAQDDDCAAGFACGGSICFRVCDLDAAAPDCPGTYLCRAFGTPVVYGGKRYGHCG